LKPFSPDTAVLIASIMSFPSFNRRQL
jgi:hypothetical protein